MDDIIIKKGNIFGKGIYANKNFKKGEIVVKYNLKLLTKKEYANLSEMEKNFVHKHWGKLLLYSSPERYVNHSSNPNTLQDLEKRCDIAIKYIRKGEEITTDAAKDDID